jgi:DNA polymerase IV
MTDKALLVSEPRKILHIDMDCFYAAIEMRDQPELANQPIAVGGQANSRGVLATANYLARESGVHSAMPSAKAKALCPNLIILPPRMDVYRDVSNQIRDIFLQYTHLVEFLSLDEAFLDVSASSLFSGSATLLAYRIKNDIYRKTKLKASAGVSYNKTLAKIASDWNKPDGLFTVRPDEAESFLAELPVNILSGIGKVAKEKLNKADIFICKDLVERPLTELKPLLGKWAEKAQLRAKGIDNRQVSPKRETKSVSIEETFSTDLKGSELVEKISEMRFRLESRLKKKVGVGLKVKSIFIKLKFSDFSQTTAQRPCQTIDQSVLEALLLVACARSSKKIRLLGIGAYIDNENVNKRQQLEIKL